MKFHPLCSTCSKTAALAAEYRTAQKTDVFRLGEEHLFFRKRMTVCYISYAEIDRFFRRVLLVPMRVSCCGGEMEVENLVICSGGRELAMVLLRDPRMAASVMEELKRRAPHAEPVKPPAGDGGENG